MAGLGTIVYLWAPLFELWSLKQWMILRPMNFDTFLGSVYVRNFFPFVAPVLDLLAAPDDILNTPNCHSYQCTSGNSDFVEGQVYTYDYDVTSITQMKSSPQDSSSLGIRSRAKIQVLSSCRFSLQVRKINFFFKLFKFVLTRSIWQFFFKLFKFVLAYSIWQFFRQIEIVQVLAQLRIINKESKQKKNTAKRK